MMRALPYVMTLLLASLITWTASRAFGQGATKEEMNHDFIFDLPGIAKQDIYDRTEKWITNNLRSPGAVIQSEDPNVGSIIANGVTTMTADGDSQAVSLSFRLSVDVREGK
ncbi:MAG TPA: DUF4468 domain-containing protein, partial [Bacteroidota bacterium]|nr:DUF4468 domain-containing protein [Bacteroidota bacterium]